MAYADAKALMGREAVVICEVDVQACTLTYGVSACTATGSGDAKCFNSSATCQDLPNFSTSTKTFRFSSVRIDELQGDEESPTYPTVTALSMAPTKLTPAKGLGIRSKVQITLQDHPDTDVGIDNYLSDRTYDPMERGSFWSKWITRWPFYESNEIRIKTGYLDADGNYDASNFITRTYFIDTVKGPTPDGKVVIVAKDALKFADREKAQIPTQSQAVLVSDITDSATSFDITDTNDDVKDAYDAGQTYIRIDDEVMNITNITGSNPTYTLTVSRATIPSVYTGAVIADAHEGEATVQHGYFFDAVEIDDIVNTLLSTYAGISGSYLPTSDWQDVVDFGLQNYTFSTLLTEPTGVKELLDEITQHTVMLWWNERDQEVQMRSIIQSDVDYGPFDDTNNVIANSVNVARDDKSRVSQVWVAYGLRTPVAEIDELKNYSGVKVSVDLDAEGSLEYEQKKVNRIMSRWLFLDKASVASEISNRLLRYYRDTKNMVTLDLDPKDDDAWTGDIITLATRQVQDFTGGTPTRTYRVLETAENFQAGGVKYQYTLQSTGSIFGTEPSRYGLIGPNTLTDYSTESEANKNKYAFIAEDDRGDGEAGFSPNEAPYIIL